MRVTRGSRRGRVVAAGLLAAALASLAAAAAPGGAAVLAPIAEQTFNDPQGDAKGRLDIASVTMRSGSDSSISMKVYIPSSKTINSGEELGMLIDTDLQASTGSPNGGYDTWWEVRGGGAGAITFYRWTGSWTRKHFASYDGSQIDFGLTVAFHLSEIGSPNAIRFYAYTRQATTNTGMDFAPDTTQWTFTIAAPSGGGSVDTTAPSRPGGLQARALGPTSVSLEWSPSTDAGGVRRYLISRNGVDIAGSVRKASYVDRTAKPGTRYTYRVQAEDRAGNISRAASTTVRTPGAATRPEVSASLNLIGPKTIPSSPVAGQQFSVGFKVQLVRTGSPRKPVRGGEVQCRATTGSRRLVVDLSGFFKGVATCAWPVPSSARGSTLRAEVTVRSGGLSATKSFSERVR